jgi:hypothetical protein
MKSSLLVTNLSLSWATWLDLLTTTTMVLRVPSLSTSHSLMHKAIQAKHPKISSKEAASVDPWDQRLPHRIIYQLAASVRFTLASSLSQCLGAPFLSLNRSLVLLQPTIRFNWVILSSVWLDHLLPQAVSNPNRSPTTNLLPSLPWIPLLPRCICSSPRMHQLTLNLLFLTLALLCRVQAIREVHNQTSWCLQVLLQPSSSSNSILTSNNSSSSTISTTCMEASTTTTTENCID